MALEKAIKTAIEYEARVRNVYQNAADQVQDPTGKGLLEVLAIEEQEHLDFLKAQLKEWQQENKLKPARLKSAIPSKEKIAESVKKLQVSVSSPEKAKELEILKKALEVEQETSDFYESMVSKLDEVGRDLFEQFIDIEKGHLSIVEAEIDNLQGLGFWFDFREFDLEAE
jgi:rubrerythrin